MSGVSRRSFLRVGAAVATGSLAGCIVGGRLKRYRIEGGRAPEELRADVSVRATDTPSRERPLSLAFEFTCTAEDATTYLVADADRFPFGIDVATNRAPEKGREPGTRTSGGEPARLVVTRRSAVSLVGNCWRVDEMPAPGAASNPPRSRIELAPGETVTGRRVLVNEPGDGGCYPLGTYRFADEYWIERGGEPRGPFEWGFTVNVNDLDVE